MDEIVRRIEQLRMARGISVSEMCAKMGPNYERWDWSRKVRRELSEFTVGELGVIADILQAPLGWPFLDASAGAAIEALLERSGKK
jgi:hypothetical protein